MGNRQVVAFLRDNDLLAAGEEAEMTSLGGGVSSDIWKVDLPHGKSVCVKSALPQLKVAEPWFAPVGRNHIEYQWLVFAETIRPGQIPHAIAQDEDAGLFAMEYLSPDRFAIWKSQLLGGEVAVETAQSVGDLVGALHDASAVDSESAQRFATDRSFDALRIDPYFRTTARTNPDLAEQLESLAESTAATHLAVVHGDVSPKNILVGPGGPVLLDAECAWFGDPAFDVAFCVNHLLIKSIKLPELADPLLRSAEAFVEAQAAHVTWEDPTDLEGRAAHMLPALALARVDGSSPVEYLDDLEQALLRRVSRALLLDPVADFHQLFMRWSELARTEGVDAR